MIWNDAESIESNIVSLFYVFAKRTQDFFIFNAIHVKNHQDWRGQITFKHYFLCSNRKFHLANSSYNKQPQCKSEDNRLVIWSSHYLGCFYRVTLTCWMESNHFKTILRTIEYKVSFWFHLPQKRTFFVFYLS